MESYGQEAPEDAQYEEVEQEQEEQNQALQEQQMPTEQADEQKHEAKKSETKPYNIERNRGGFIHGLSVGLGIGCIATFIIMWVTVYFTPQLPSVVTYEGMLSIFIYPLIYLLTVGLIALTAGIVREYYSGKGNF